MKNKKIRVGIFIYAMSMMLALVIYLNLDWLVGKFVRTEVNDLSLVDFHDYAPKDEVIVALDPIRIQANDFETISFSGRSSVVTENYNNEDKTVTILFLSGDACYASKRRTIFGGPVEPAVHSYNHNFSRDISTLPLPNGSYDLYL